MRPLIIEYLQSGLLGFFGTLAFMGLCFWVRAILDRYMPPRRGPRG